MVAVRDELGLTELVCSIKGLSAVGAAAILAETGDPARFATPRSMVKHAGLASAKEPPAPTPGAPGPAAPAQPRAFLERLALRLLQAMGYGGRESLAEHTGRPGDAGLDGLVRPDALGLELVGVQAKRYDKELTVNRPEIQAFVGALQGAHTNRGVSVTTGRFSPGVRQFAENVAMCLVLIDGGELTRLMVRLSPRLPAAPQARHG